MLCQVTGVSGSGLDLFFKQSDFLGTPLCTSYLNSSHAVYIVQTTGKDTHTSGFLSVFSPPSSSVSHILKPIVRLQRQASSASSAASLRSFSRSFLTAHSGTLRLQLVCQKHISLSSEEIMMNEPH